MRSQEATEFSLKSLFHLPIWPDHNGDHDAIAAGFVQHRLAQFHPAFFKRKTEVADPGILTGEVKGTASVLAD